MVGITGASGAVYARRLIGVLAQAGHAVELVISPAGFAVLRQELDWDAPRYAGPGGLTARCRRFFEPPGASGPVSYHPIHDIWDELASGSAAVEAMVVIPCSMGRAAAIAGGRAADLLERCADVCLKEGRPLVLVPRETPLSLIHLRNLAALAEAGAVILPAMPGFYQGARSLQDLVDFVVAKVLARLGLRLEADRLLPPWRGRPRGPVPAAPESGAGAPDA